MKTYTSPTLISIGSVSGITADAGGGSFRDTYLNADGTTTIGFRGNVPSDFGCQDTDQNNCLRR